MLYGSPKLQLFLSCGSHGKVGQCGHAICAVSYWYHLTDSSVFLSVVVVRYRESSVARGRYTSNEQNVNPVGSESVFSCWR
jgi:hypothetical protein